MKKHTAAASCTVCAHLVEQKQAIRPQLLEVCRLREVREAVLLRHESAIYTSRI